MVRAGQEIASVLCVPHPAIGLLAAWSVDSHWAPKIATHELAFGSLLLTPTWFVWPLVLWALRLRGRALLIRIGIGLALELGLIACWLIPLSIVGAH